MNKEENLNKTENTGEEHNDNSQDNQSSHEANTQNTQYTIQQIQTQQSGFIAAGFKKFVKKSISIKLKTTDSSINNTIKQDENKIDRNQQFSNRYEDKYIYDVDSDDYNEVRNELNSILEMESSGKENRTKNYLFKNDSKHQQQQNSKYLRTISLLLLTRVSMLLRI